MVCFSEPCKLLLQFVHAVSNSQLLRPSTHLLRLNHRRTAHVVQELRKLKHSFDHWKETFKKRMRDTYAFVQRARTHASRAGRRINSSSHRGSAGACLAPEFACARCCAFSCQRERNTFFACSLPPEWRAHALRLYAGAGAPPLTVTLAAHARAYGTHFVCLLRTVISSVPVTPHGRDTKTRSSPVVCRLRPERHAHPLRPHASAGKPPCQPSLTPPRAPAAGVQRTHCAQLHWRRRRWQSRYAACLDTSACAPCLGIGCLFVAQHCAGTCLRHCVSSCCPLVLALAAA